MNDKDKFDSEKRNEEGLNFHQTNLPPDWRFASNIQHPFIAENSPTALPSRASPSMPDSISPNIWNHSQAQNLACGESNLQNSFNLSHMLPRRPLGRSSSLRSGMERPLDYCWNSSNSQSKDAVFTQTGAGILHQNFSQFPADSGFIERAARFSFFGGGNYSDITGPFQNLELINPFSASAGIQSTQIISSNNGKGADEAVNKEMELLKNGPPLHVSWQIDTAAGKSLEKDDRDTQTLVKPSNEENIGIETKLGEVTEAKFDGQADLSHLESSGEEPFSAEFGLKKRKRSNQDAELDLVNVDGQSPGEAAKENIDCKQGGQQNIPLSTPKLHGKSGKDGSKSLTAPPKDDYIHVRARRGQATNSHSLAERVRREKISERMKFLQDLVPGCSKVTGKAVMLDEIINYVQSLQRQVEFLSMKLATVNPCLDFNLDGYLSKDTFHTRGASSSVIGFSPDMAMVHPQLHLSQQGLMHTVVSGIRNPPSSLRRISSSSIAAVNEFNTAPSQMPNAWDEELHNVVQMNFENDMHFTKEPSGENFGLRIST